MPLEVAIEKQVSGFRLAVEFTADGAPLGLLGPSGSGKTMTLRAIAGLEKPDRGRIVLHGRVIFDSQRGINVPARERRIGLLFQNYALFPHLTVAENIAFGLHSMPRPERTRRVAVQLAATHLTNLASRYPASLSGGEQQRVALARALAPRPAILVADEPTGNLDDATGKEIVDLMFARFSAHAMTLVLVTHDTALAHRCDRVIRVRSGHVEEEGATV